MSINVRSINRLEIDLGAIKHNLEELVRLLSPGTAWTAVVKADAYGHGLLPVAETVLEAGAQALCVAETHEAAKLREAGITARIIKLIPALPREYQDMLATGLEEVIVDAPQAEMLNAFARDQNITVFVHAKVDTGMSRLGTRPEQFPALVEFIQACSHLELVGVMSHLACSDIVESDFTKEQVDRFRSVQVQLGSLSETLEWHIGNSGAVLAHPIAHQSLVRIGLAMYGLIPAPQIAHAERLRPAMRFTSRLVQVRKGVPAGTPIGYGGTFVTPEPMDIGTIPVGYAAGYFRALSNRALVLAGGQRCAVIGRVSMNLITVNLNGVQAQAGDEVVLLGAQDQEKITAEELAGWAQTINYEIATSLGAHNQRYWLNR